MRKCQLVDNWKDVLKYANSIRWAVVTGLLSAGEVAMQFFLPDRPHGLLAIGALLASFAIPVARIVVQRKLQDETPETTNG